MILIIKDRRRLFILTLYVLPIAGILLSGMSAWRPYSYWLDELYSITASSLGFTDMFRSMLTDVHPPLYQVLLWFWIRLLSDYEPIVRGFSLICSLLAVSYLYGWGKRLDGCTRILILTFFATSWLFSYYAQEARSYALLLFLSTVTIGLFVVDDGSRKSYWQILCAVILLALTHYFGLILAGGVLCWLFCQNLKYPKRLMPVCGVAVIALVWPVIQYFEGALGSKAGGKFWIQVDGAFGTLTVFLQALAPVIKTFEAKLQIVLIVFSVSVLAILLVYRFRQACRFQNCFEKSVILKTLFCLVWVLATVTIIDTHTPISTERNYIALLPLVSILFGLALGAVREIKYASIAILIVAICWGKMQLDHSHTLLKAKATPFQNWKESAEYLVHHAAGQKLYYLRLNDTDEIDRVFNYYVQRFSKGALKVERIYASMLKSISSPAMLFVGGVAANTINQIVSVEDITPKEAFYPAQSWQNSTAILSF
jgi:uncharacterized membrane protein